MVLDQPGDAVECAALFIGGERQDQVAIGLVMLLLQAKKGRDQKRVAILDVSCAAAVKVAVLLDELERVDRPVLAARFDDVQMAYEQQRFLRARAVNARD